MKLTLPPGLIPKANARKDSEVFQAPSDVLRSTLAAYLFYRDGYRTLVFFSLWLGLALIGLTLFCCVVILSARPQDRFFTASVDGRVDQLLPLDTPTSSVAEMQGRVSLALTDALTFGYLDYEQRRAENQGPFSASAYDKLYRMIIGREGLERMYQEPLVFCAEPEPSMPAGVLRSGINKYFIYEWVFQIPLRVVVKADTPGAEPHSVAWVVQALVERATDVDVRSGYIITDILSATQVPAPPSVAGGG